MTETDKTYRIFLSAAEPSADSHCAGLITALKKSGYNIDFVGVGGAKMASAGCKLLETNVGQAAMIYKAFSKVGHFYKLIKRIKAYLKKEKIDLVIVCDSPAFNFHVAKAAKKAKIKTIFYVAVQLWAWGGWRIDKLRKCCDKLCCILPFEQDWFRQRGIDTIFVGNPLLDQLDVLSGYRKDYSDFKPQDVRIALMPGSRSAEIETLWQPMQQIAVRIRKKYPNATFTTVAVDDRGKEALKSTQILGFRCKYTIRSVCDTAQECDFTIVASGSATLQVAAVGCPMVIMYQSSKILWYLLGRWLLKTKYLSLINILAEKELVPEFMPYFSSIEPIAEAIEQLLSERDKLAQLSSQLIQLAEPLRQASASENTARIVIDMLSQYEREISDDFSTKNAGNGS